MVLSGRWVLGVVGVLLISSCAVEPVRSGPFLRLGDAPVVREGTQPRDVTVVDGMPAAIAPGGVAALDERGRAQVIAETPDDPPTLVTVIGVAGGRMLRWASADTLAITDLASDDVAVATVTGVAAAGHLGADGVVWVQATADPPGATRRLDIARWAGQTALDAVFLPVITILPPSGAEPVDVADTWPIPGGAAAVRTVPEGSGHALERVRGDAGGTALVEPLAGGAGPPCGPDGPLAVGPDGSVWFVAQDRLRLLDRAGTVRTVAAPLPGPVVAMAVGAEEAPILLTSDRALWSLTDPSVALPDPLCSE